MSDAEDAGLDAPIDGDFDNARADYGDQDEPQLGEDGDDSPAGSDDDPDAGESGDGGERGGQGSAGDGNAAAEEGDTQFRVQLAVKEDGAVGVGIRTVAEVEEEERLSAELAAKLAWLDEVWGMEDEAEGDINQAAAASDDERATRVDRGPQPGASTSGRTLPAAGAPLSKVRARHEAAAKYDRQLARGRLLKKLEEVREREGRIRATRDEMEAKERMMKDLQSQVEALEAEADRQATVQGSRDGPATQTRRDRMMRAVDDAYDKLDEAMGRLQQLQEIHYGEVLARNEAEVELAALEADAADISADDPGVTRGGLPTGSVGGGTQGAPSVGDGVRGSHSAVELELSRADVAVRAFHTRRDRAMALRRGAEREAEEQRKRAVNAARAGRLKAILRIREKVAELNERQLPINALRNELKEKRIQGLVRLKKSVDQAFSEVLRRNEMRERRLRDRLHRQKEEFDAMAEGGLNPYEVFRQRDIEQRLARKQKALESRIKRAEMVLMERMIREDEIYNRETAAKRVEEEYKEKFQKEMGREAKERKLRKWMMTHNRTGKELLDPTGRVPVHPSEVAMVKPSGFGLGVADEYALEHVRKAHGRNVPLVDVLLPRSYQQPKEAEEVAELPDDAGPGSPRKLAASAAALESTFGAAAAAAAKGAKGGDASESDRLGRDTLAQPEFAPLWVEEESRETRRLYKPKLSRAEVMKLEALKRQHKEMVPSGGRAPGEVTIVMNREFKGAGFLVTPKEVVFRDFEVGETYRQKITLTNVFWTKNTFKVMEMPPEVRNFFDVEYSFPGLVSAGITCDVYVNFEPKRNEDIATHIPIITQTGPVTVPVRCLRKRATLSLSAPIVYFQKITIGEAKEQQAQIINNGALAVDFKWEVVSIESALKEPPAEQKRLMELKERGADDWALERLFKENMSAARLKELGFLLSEWKGSVKPYSRTSFSVSFQPPGIGICTAKLRAAFTVHDDVKEYIPEVELELRGDAGDLPVVCESQVIDLQCMIRGQAYTVPLRMVNRSSVAIKCFLQRNQVMQKYLQVYPGVGYVQAHDTFAFSLKFKPTSEMLDEIKGFAKVSRDGDDGDFEIPMRVAVPDQALPATFTLKGSLTTSDIRLEPTSLDFGDCALGEATGLHLTMTNLARLPQKYGFCNLRRGLQVQPNDGFGTLLPGQTVSCVVSYTPDISGTHHFPLDLRTLLGRHFVIPCRAVVTPLPVLFDKNRVTMPVTEVGRSSQTSVRLRNQSATHCYTFQFTVPLSSRIKVSPNVGRLSVNSTIRVEVSYSPKEEDFGELGEAGIMKPGGEMRDAGSEVAPGTEDAHLWVQRGDWTVSCFLREEEYVPEGPRLSIKPSAAREMESLKQDAKDAPGVEVMPIHLQVVTAAKLPELVLDGPVEWRPEIASYQMNFGEVALGQRVLKNLTVFNNGPRKTFPVLSALNHRETFSVVNPAQEIAPLTGHGLLVAYCPEKAGKHRELLTLSSRHTSVKVALVGTGISPSFEVDKDRLDLGDVYRGETATESFTIENTSPFPLKYKLQLKEGAHTNIGGTPVFVVKPSEGTIPSEGAQEVEVTFLPDHEYLYFENVLSVLVPNQEEDVTVSLQGRCWEKGMYIIGGDRVTAIEDPFKSKQLAKFEGLKPAINLTLTFPNEVFPGEVSKGTLEVGNLNALAGKEKGDFQVVELSHANKEAGWSVSPEKGTVDPGRRVPLTFSFRCPDDPGRLNLAYLDMGGWIEASIDVVLKGGFPAPKDAGGTVYRIRARCYIKPARKKAAKKGLRFKG